MPAHNRVSRGYPKVDCLGDTMMMNDDIDRCAPEHLAELIGAGIDDHEHGSADDLATLLQYELDVPVSFDLGGLTGREAEDLQAQCHSDRLVLKSLGDLFRHPHPPVELLEMTKRYAKACRQDLDSSVPEEIAAVLYFTSVATALVKCQRRITELDDASLGKGLERVLALPWLDTSLRDLLSQTLDGLKEQEADS